jgi:hypothetical protein
MRRITRVKILGKYDWVIWFVLAFCFVAIIVLGLAH